jgi:hypothetical protein
MQYGHCAAGFLDLFIFVGLALPVERQAAQVPSRTRAHAAYLR